MINVLIADDNVEYAVNLMNYINKKNENIKICNIAKDGKETLEIMNLKNNIDVVLLDYKMPFYNGKQIIEQIKNKSKYQNSIIIISGEVEDSLKLRQYEMVHSIIFKTTNIDEIVRRINELFEYKEKIKKTNIIKNSIIKELLYLGYDISHKGTQYLIKVIEYIISNPEMELEKLEKIYSKIAHIYNTTTSNIKCRINKATTEMYYNCGIEKLKRYFNFDTDIKPKVKTVINTIIIKLYDKM